MQARVPSKTPYEIRLDLLTLAQSILNNQNIATATIVDGHLVPLSAATTEQIVAEAEKLNQFISKSN